MDNDTWTFLDEEFNSPGPAPELDSPQLAPLDSNLLPDIWNSEEKTDTDSNALKKFDNLIKQIPKPIQKYDPNGFPNFLKIYETDCPWLHKFYDDFQSAKDALRFQKYPGYIVCSSSILKHIRTDRRRKNEIIPLIHFALPQE